MSKKNKTEVALLSIQKNLQAKSEHLSLQFNHFLNPEKVNNLLGQCVHLKKLDLRAVKTLPKAKTLQTLENLEYLDLSYTSVKDISFLKSLKKLEQLYLDHTKVEDISVLKNLEYLNYLNVAHTGIRDISPLKDLKYLEYLEAEGNYIQDITCFKQVEQLRQLLVSCEFIKPYPSIWYARLVYKNGEERLSNLNQLSELPFVEKIWELIITQDEDNLQLARQLAKGQGWEDKDFAIYVKLVYG